MDSCRRLVVKWILTYFYIGVVFYCRYDDGGRWGWNSACKNTVIDRVVVISFLL